MDGNKKKLEAFLKYIIYFRRYKFFIKSGIRMSGNQPLREVSKFGVFSGLFFSVLGFNSEIYSVNLGSQYKNGAIQTRKNSKYRLLSCSALDMHPNFERNTLLLCNFHKFHGTFLPVILMKTEFWKLMTQAYSESCQTY